MAPNRSDWSPSVNSVISSSLTYCQCKSSNFIFTTMLYLVWLKVEKFIPSRRTILDLNIYFLSVFYCSVLPQYSFLICDRVRSLSTTRWCVFALHCWLDSIYHMSCADTAKCIEYEPDIWMARYRALVLGLFNRVPGLKKS